MDRADAIAAASSNGSSAKRRNVRGSGWRVAFDDEGTGCLRPGGDHLQARPARELAELGDGFGPASTTMSISRGAPRVVGRDPAHDDDPTARPGRLRAAAKDGLGLPVGPVVQHLLHEVA